MKKTLIKSQHATGEALDDIQLYIRADRCHDAATLLMEGSGKPREWAQREIDREAEFLETIARSEAAGSELSATALNPRQALIMAALVGLSGDEPCIWFSPAGSMDLLAWAQSHYQGEVADLEVALEAQHLGACKESSSGTGGHCA